MSITISWRLQIKFVIYFACVWRWHNLTGERIATPIACTRDQSRAGGGGDPCLPGVYLHIFVWEYLSALPACLKCWTALPLIWRNLTSSITELSIRFSSSPSHIYKNNSVVRTLLILFRLSFCLSTSRSFKAVSENGMILVMELGPCGQPSKQPISRISQNSESQGATLNHVPIFHGLLLRFTLPMSKDASNWMDCRLWSSVQCDAAITVKDSWIPAPPTFREVLEIDVLLASNHHSWMPPFHFNHPKLLLQQNLITVHKSL